MGDLPFIGEQLADLILGMGADAFEDIAHVCEGIDVEPLAGGDKAGQDGRGLSAVVTPIKHPVFSFMEILS